MNKKIFRKFFFTAFVLCLFFSPLAVKAKGLVTLNNNKLQYKDLVSSSSTILFVWTTWCPYCRKELKNLLAQNIRLENISLYFVNIGERKSTVERFLRSLKVPVHLKEKIIIDVSGIVARKFSISGIPAYIFLKDDKVIWRSLYLDQDLINTLFEVK